MAENQFGWEELNNIEPLMPEEFIRLSQDIVDFDAQDTASISSTEVMPYSDIGESNRYIPGSKYDPLPSDGSAPWEWPIRRYATGELNFNAFELPIAPDAVSASVGDYRPKTGFVSKSVFSEGNDVSITVSFGSSMTFSVPGISIQWCVGTAEDATTSEYAKSFRVDVLSDGAVSKSITVDNNQTATSLVNVELSTCSGLKITVLEWCIPNRRVRIEQIVIGQSLVFDKTQILSYTHESSRDPISAQLSKDSISYTLDNADQRWNPLNPDGIYRFLYLQQPVVVYYGIANSVESSTPSQWVLGGHFYLSEWSVPSNSISASFTARDLFSFLMESEYTGRRYGTLYDMVNDAIELYKNRFPSENSEIDTALKNYSADFTKENSSYKNSDIVQMAANAAGMCAFQSRNGTLHIGYIEDIQQENHEIAELNNYNWPEITFSKPLKSVSATINQTVYTYPESPVGSGATQTVSNPLVSSSIVSQNKNVLSQAYSVLTNRRKASLSYRAVPLLDALDEVSIHHQFGYVANVLLTNAKYTFSGGFKGELEGYILADVSSIGISQNSAALDFTNPSVTLSASIHPYSEDSPVINWSASPSDVVALHVVSSESGKSTCRVEWTKAGTAIVFASAGRIKASCFVTANNLSLVSIPEGTVLKLKENGSAVEFIVAKHNYLPDYNTNRTLLIRSVGYKQMRFNEVGENPIEHSQWIDDQYVTYYDWISYNAYANSEIDKWLTGSYLNLFSSSTQSKIRTTTLHPKTRPILDDSVLRSVFLLCANELGVNYNGVYKDEINDAPLLPTRSKIMTGYIANMIRYTWTRSPLRDGTADGLSGEAATKASYERVCAVMGTGGVSVPANSTNVWVRPAFTVPGTMMVDGLGNIIE